MEYASDEVFDPNLIISNEKYTEAEKIMNDLISRGIMSGNDFKILDEIDAAFEPAFEDLSK